MAKFKACVAVYGVLTHESRVLLMRRAGSGYRDGQLALPAGHLDGGEDVVTAMIRELREELGIRVSRDDCELRSVLHRSRETPQDNEYVDLIFSIKRWAGEPSIVEEDKCSELVWADLENLPADVVDYVAEALACVRRGQMLATIGWNPSGERG